jgi:hypothetical protein
VGQAFALVLLGSAVAIWAGWRWAWQLGRDRDRRPEHDPKTRIPT